MNVHNAALSGKGSEAVVLRAKTVSIEGNEIDAVLCTLRPKTSDQCGLQLVFAYDVPTTFHVSGDKGIELHLSGYYQPAPDDDGSDDEYGDMPYDDEDSDDDEVATNTKANASGKLVIEDVGDDDEESSDEDDDDEEDGVDAAFIQVGCMVSSSCRENEAMTTSLSIENDCPAQDWQDQGSGGR